MTKQKEFKRFRSAPRYFRLFGYEIRIAKVNSDWKYTKKAKEEKPLAVQEELKI